MLVDTDLDALRGRADYADFLCDLVEVDNDDMDRLADFAPTIPPPSETDPGGPTCHCFAGWAP